MIPLTPYYRFHVLVTFIIILISHLSFAQTASIHGKVSSNNAAVPFANVYLKTTHLGGLTDIQGDYQISSIPAGTYTLVVSSLGYDKVEKTIVLKESDHTVINIILHESSSSLDAVVISGTMKEVTKLASPVPVEVYLAQFFKANPTASIFESLQNINGVRPQLNCNVCNTGDIHINGLEGPYTMVMIDGMPIVSGLSSVYGLSGIPQSLIERVEIVKGPASTLYGSEAVGGLINIITKKPGNAAIFSSDMFGTSWGEVNTDVAAKYKLSKKTSSILGINYFNYQHPIDHNSDGFTDISLQNRISVFNKISINSKDNREFSIAARYVYEDRWGGEMDWTKEHRGGNQIYGESIYTSRWESFGIYQLPTKERIHLRFSATGHKQNSAYGNTMYLADQNILFGLLSWNKTTEHHDFLTGLAYRYTYYDDNTPATESADSLLLFNHPSITHLPGFFVQDEIEFNPKNSVLLGLRFDYHSLHGAILSPRVNYKWTSVNKKNVLRLSAGNGYRVANVFTEDHAALTGARTVEFNGELQPETSWNVNINGVKKIYSKAGVFMGLDASVFYTYFMNQILPDYLTDPNKIIYSNLSGSSVSKGISLNLDFASDIGLKIVAGGTLMDVSVNENGSKFRQMLTERFSGVWNLGYTFKTIGLSVDYTGNIYGPMRLPLLGELDDRPEYSPWWSIQNIQLSKKFKQSVELYAGVKNLLNFTPPANSIARAFDPFDKNVIFNSEGKVVPTAENPNALTFDPSYVFAPNQGIRGFLGFRYTFR